MRNIDVKAVNLDFSDEFGRIGRIKSHLLKLLLTKQIVKQKLLFAKNLTKEKNHVKPVNLDFLKRVWNTWGNQVSPALTPRSCSSYYSPNKM